MPVLVYVACQLAGCAHIPESHIPLGGAPDNDLTQVAQIVEDPEHPLLLRGLDGVALRSLRVPSAFTNYAYLVRPGRHVLWVVNAPYGYPIFPQKLRCYVVHAELAQGTRYRLKEDSRAKRALLLKDDTGAAVSAGELVDEPWVFARDCRWP